MSNLLKDNKNLMKQWNYEKNKDLDLDNLTLGSNKKVWWKCSKGHEWQTAIVKRSNGSGCPFCTGKKRIIGKNDIFTLHPNWIKYWDYELNEIDPYSCGEKSHKKVNWVCSECGKKFIREIVKMKDEVLCFDCANIIGKKINIIDNC